MIELAFNTNMTRIYACPPCKNIRGLVEFDMKKRLNGQIKQKCK